MAAGLEWLAAAESLGQPEDEKRARLAVASCLSGDARESVAVSAALLEPRIHPSEPSPLVVGHSAATRLANLELSPPGCDPRRRAAALGELNGALGDEAGLDAAVLAGWAALAAGDLEGARAAFERGSLARPGDLAAWEGLRAVGELAGDGVLRARAAAELGARCNDSERGAAFWEETALLCLELGDEVSADRSLDASFERDPRRVVAFDKLFRRVRGRKDNDKLLAIIGRRLEVTDEPQEIQKLYWEQARVMREKGDEAAALKALEHVTMLDPDHVGALTLVGEIERRRGNFEQAADSLGRLASLSTAPPKNREIAGVVAVDLYENKLNRFDKALAILTTLHKAHLSTLPLRERLARAAARTGSWKDATAILEELMLERPDADGRIEAARLAMAIHRDRLGTPQDAAAAIVKLLEESPTDGEALDMLLETRHAAPVRQRLLESARGALVQSLQSHPTNASSVRRLIKVARASSDDGLEQSGLAALVSIGGADATAEQRLAQLAAKKGRTPQSPIRDAKHPHTLAPGDDGPISELFMLLGPTVAEALGPNLQACGVGRRDRVDARSGLALRNETGTWMGAFGVQEFDLYVGGRDPLGVQGIPGEPPALVVGAGVNAPLSSLTRARVAREALAIVRGTTIVHLRDDITIAALVAASCKLGEVHIEHPAYAVLAEVERQLGKAIARRTRKLLPEVCAAIARAGSDARAWSKRALASQDRAAVIASGDVSVVLSDVFSIAPDKLGSAVKGHGRAEELLRFVLSPTYLELRRALGLEGDHDR